MGFEYKPFSPKQLEVIKSDLARINVLEGSVRSGKTIASIIRWATYVGRETSPNAKLLMLGVTGDTLKRNVVDDLMEIVGTKHSHYRDGILTLFGRTVYCVGARDEGQEKRIRGMTVEGAYVDEATMIPQSVIKQAILRCSKGKGRLIFTTNPDSPFHPFHVDYVANEKGKEAGRIKVWHFGLDDNYALSEDYKDDIKASFTGLWYDRMVKGLWVLAEGVIYDQFGLDAHGFTDEDAPNEFDRLDLALDYGTQNAFAALLVGVKGDTSWVLDEWYYSGRDNQRQMTDGEYADAINKWLGDRPVRKVFIDPSAASFITELKKRGVKGVTPADNDVVPGIRTVAGRLAAGKLKIHKTNCPHLVREMGVYSWDAKACQRGEDKPLKQNDHAPDALRYHEHTLFGKPKGRIVAFDGGL